MRNVRLIVLLPFVSLLAGCDAREQVSRLFSTSSKSGHFNITSDQNGKQVILLNTKTGKTWKLEGNKWMPLQMPDDSSDPLALLAEDEAVCKGKNARDLSSAQLCACMGKRFDPKTRKCL